MVSIFFICVCGYTGTQNDAEPTSALDSESSLKVEEYIKQMISDPTSPTRAVVWITHSPEQGKRVGTRFITVANGQCIEEPRTQA